MQPLNLLRQAVAQQDEPTAIVALGMCFPHWGHAKRRRYALRSIGDGDLSAVHRYMRYEDANERAVVYECLADAGLTAPTDAPSRGRNHGDGDRADPTANRAITAA